VHKLRSCLSQFGARPLDGSVEVDETYLGGEDDDLIKGAALRDTKTPAPLRRVARRSDRRIRVAAVLNATALSLCGSSGNVAGGSR